MFVFRVAAALAACALLASGAEVKGTWSATSPRGNLAGTWTADDHQAAGVTGTWTLQDPSGKILLQGSWTSSVAASPKADVIEMFTSALRAVVSGTWKAGSSTGAWSIRALP